ncbi:hypothetical protein [Umezakia ovalisporum]|jgi:hypothetical protein|uniref:hypothetical protein n=1 Tax=Umezakia ovalisporum TaxID=75695 RepID=UPI0024762B96|nr:hypothetical protein [Umezakia ovalisporum]MBI1241634.1 hypothetical protein [Nostoc sp. RI_552]MDH6086560.1 hypothetical protein [Umezakia ovalisporum TAC611]MDH6087611.1 hypothetical protein [Umezakia ovalisporum Ak1311]
MSTNNTNKIKLILSILAVTSVAALNPSAYSQTVKPGNIDNFLNRANLNINPGQLEPTEINKLPAVEKLPTGTIKKPGAEAWNVSCNGACADPVKKQINQNSLPQIQKNPVLKPGR